MAEWSKAPDSRFKGIAGDFWSSYEGVGSNPTSDKYFWQIFVQTVSKGESLTEA